MHPPPPPTVSPSAISWVSEAHLLQLMNLCWHIFIKQSPWFLLWSLFVPCSFMSFGIHPVSCIHHYSVVQISFKTLNLSSFIPSLIVFLSLCRSESQACISFLLCAKILLIFFTRQIYWLQILIYWLKLFISVLLKYYFSKLLILGWELFSFNILNILFCVFWFLLTLLKVSYLPNCCSFKGSLPLFTSSCFKTFSLVFKVSQLGPWCFSLYSF